MERIGKLWEIGQITVSAEHLATTIVNRLIPIIRRTVPSIHSTGNSAILACPAGEQHQLGVQIASELLASYGWQTLLLGANTPTDDLVKFIDQMHPNLLCLSLTIPDHLPSLLALLIKVTALYPDLPILASGSAFRTLGTQELQSYTNVSLVEDLTKLPAILTSFVKHTRRPGK